MEKFEGPNDEGPALRRRRRQHETRGRSARFGVAAFRSPLASFFVALALLAQLAALPYHRSLVAAEMAAPSPAQIVAELKATFGEAAQLCVQTDNSGAPASPAGHCDDDCPLCRFSSQLHAVVAPDAPGLPAPLEALALAAPPAPDRFAFADAPHSNQRARAPPASV